MNPKNEFLDLIKIDFFQKRKIFGKIFSNEIKKFFGLIKSLQGIILLKGKIFRLGKIFWTAESSGTKRRTFWGKVENILG